MQGRGGCSCRRVADGSTPRPTTYGPGLSRAEHSARASPGSRIEPGRKSAALTLATLTGAGSVRWAECPNRGVGSNCGEISATIQPPANRPFTITITFPEPVTDFTVDDLVIDGGDASEFTGGGAVYTALVTPTDSGTLTIDIPAGAAFDASGYESEAANTLSIEVDITPPTGVISTQEPGPFKEPFTIQIIFSEPIQDLTREDISISLGQVSDLEETDVSQTEYTALVTPEGTGTLVIALPAQTFYDYNGRWNEAPVRLEVEIDTVRPMVQITSDSDRPVPGPFPLRSSSPRR